VTKYEKRCRKCKKVQSTLEFGFKKNGKDGLRAQCNTCKRAADKIYRDAHREHYIQLKRDWRLKKRAENASR
jgi:hypothetical protein